MVNTGTSKLTGSGIKQVGLVVNSVDETAEYYLSNFGIGPFFTLEQEFTDATYWGKPCLLKAKFGLARMGPVQIELIEPLGGYSVYADFLSQRGEGIHHLGFYVNDLDEEIALLQKHGIGVIQGGRVDDGGFIYTDTEGTGGITFEFIQRPTPPPRPASSKPKEPPPPPPPSTVRLEEINQIGVAVKDAEKVMHLYSSVFGMGPWKVQEIGSTPSQEQRGEQSWGVKQAYTQVGTVELELIEVTKGRTIQSHFLETKGEGMQNLGTFVPDLETSVDKLQEVGVGTLLVARIGNGGFAYLDSTAVGGSILKLIKRPT